MKDMITLRLTGHLTALTPISTCPPGVKEAQRTVKNDPAPLPRMSIDGAWTPYFPGGGLRGTLRRRAVDVVRAALSVDGKPPFTLEDHYYLVLGGVKGDDKESKADILGAHARRLANPVAGLFGSGDPWQFGHLYVSHAVPQPGARTDVVRGARVDDFSRSGESLQLLSPEERERWVEAATANNARSKAKREKKEPLERDLRANGISDKKKAEIKAKLEVLEAEIKELDELTTSTNSVGRPLDGYEVIPPGTAMAQSITLKDATPDEVGLLLAALRFWALDPWVGAHRAHGCGVLSGEWWASVRRGQDLKYKGLGRVAVTPFEGVEAPEEMVACEEAFMAALRGDGRFDFRYRSAAA